MQENATPPLLARCDDFFLSSNDHFRLFSGRRKTTRDQRDNEGEPSVDMLCGFFRFLRESWQGFLGGKTGVPFARKWGGSLPNANRLLVRGSPSRNARENVDRCSLPILLLHRFKPAWNLRRASFVQCVFLPPPSKPFPTSRPQPSSNHFRNVNAPLSLPLKKNPWAVSSLNVPTVLFAPSPHRQFCIVNREVKEDRLVSHPPQLSPRCPPSPLLPPPPSSIPRHAATWQEWRSAWRTLGFLRRRSTWSIRMGGALFIMVRRGEKRGEATRGRRLGGGEGGGVRGPALACFCFILLDLALSCLILLDLACSRMPAPAPISPLTRIYI